MPHGQHIKDERKDVRFGNFSLDGSSHETGNAAFTPATPHDLQQLESQHRLKQLKHHERHESKTKHTLLYAKGHSAQPDKFWRTHHTKPDPKSMRVMPLAYGEYKLD
jgi:hypothetical protein